MTRELHIGDIVKHFKRETIENPATEYLYRIIAFAHHSETDERSEEHTSELQSPQ